MHEIINFAAHKLFEPMFAVNAQEMYRSYVNDYLITARLSGHTYNAEIFLTLLIFDVLLEKMEKLGATKIASGHFAKIFKNQTTGELWTTFMGPANSTRIDLYDFGMVDNSSALELFEGTAGLINALNQECLLPTGQKAKSYVSCAIGRLNPVK